MPLNKDQVLDNRYRILQPLGQGGFGTVYQAWDTRLDGFVAVKEILDPSPDAVRQFQFEARVLFNLRHPGLPKVIDSFSLPGQGQYLVMEYVGGEDLAHLLRHTGTPLPEAQAVGYILQAACRPGMRVRPANARE